MIERKYADFAWEQTASLLAIVPPTGFTAKAAAVTAEGALEYRTKIADREMPMMPMTIMIMGCFSMYFIGISIRNGRTISPLC